jgi:hypothetical protein
MCWGLLKISQIARKLLRSEICLWDLIVRFKRYRKTPTYTNEKISLIGEYLKLIKKKGGHMPPL